MKQSKYYLGRFFSLLFVWDINGMTNFETIHYMLTFYVGKVATIKKTQNQK